MQVLGPILLALANRAAEMDRQHQISSRLISASRGAAKKGARVAGDVLAMNDGMVLQVVQAMTLYCVYSVGSGLRDGLQGGYKVLEERNADAKTDEGANGQPVRQRGHWRATALTRAGVA